MTAMTNNHIGSSRGLYGHRAHRTPLCLVALLCSWVVLNGQVRQSPGEGGGPAASDTPPSLEAAPTILSLSDSLDFALIDIDIRKAKARVRQTAFWLRLIPEIRITRSYPIPQLIPEEVPYNSAYYTYRPYSISFSFSIKDILDNSAHEQAQLDIERLEAERLQLLLQKRRSRIEHVRELSELRDLMHSIRSEIGIVTDLLAFDQLRFDQGNLSFDQLMRTKLELIKTQRALKGVEHQITQLRSKLSPSDIR